MLGLFVKKFVKKSLNRLLSYQLNIQGYYSHLFTLLPVPLICMGWQTKVGAAVITCPLASFSEEAISKKAKHKRDTKEPNGSAN